MLLVGINYPPKVLPANHRLNLRFHRQRLSSQGKTVYSPFFTYQISLRSSVDPSPIRIALIISKKLIPTAVGRNRFRRHLTEHLRSVIDQYPSGIDLILIPKKVSLTADIELLLEDISHTLNRTYATS